MNLRMRHCAWIVFILVCVLALSRAGRAQENPDNFFWPSPRMQQVYKTVTTWAQAWSAQDVGTYLSFYDAGFQIPRGNTRQGWEKHRRQRLSAPGFIEIMVRDVEIEVFDDTTARVRFTQIYQSDSYRDQVNKILLFKKSNMQWKIMQEITTDEFRALQLAATESLLAMP